MLKIFNKNSRFAVCNGNRRFIKTQTILWQSNELDKEWNEAKPFKSIPGMGKLEAVRSFLPGGKFHKVPLKEVNIITQKQYGNISRFPDLFGVKGVVTIFDPNDIEKVFRTEGVLPNRRTLDTLKYFRDKYRPDVYKEVGGLISEQGESWQKLRSVTNPVMMQPRAAKSYVSKVDEITKDFIKLIDKNRDQNNEVPENFSDFVNRLSLESITCIALDRRLGILNEGEIDKTANDLINYIHRFFELSFEFEILPSIWRTYQTSKFKELLNVYDGMTRIILNYIEEAYSQKLQNKAEAEQSILEKLLKINKNAALVMVNEMMMAGVDTTSSATISTLYCLAKNPEKQEKLREEIIKILPEKDSPLTADNMKDLPYLRAIIKESLRLYPPAIGNIRKSGRKLVLQGYQVPEGVDIVMATNVLQTTENYYPQTEKFLPERWLKDSELRGNCPAARDAHPFTYLPFGFGKRMCIGKRFAELEIEVFIARIIRNYKIEWHHADMKIKSVLVNVPIAPLKFRMIDF